MSRRLERVLDTLRLEPAGPDTFRGIEHAHAARPGLRRAGARPGAAGRGGHRAGRSAAALGARLLPAAGRRRDADHVRRRAAARRQVVHGAAHARASGRPSDPVDDQLVPARPAGPGPPGHGARGARPGVAAGVPRRPRAAGPSAGHVLGPLRRVRHPARRRRPVPAAGCRPARLAAGLDARPRSAAGRPGAAPGAPGVRVRPGDARAGAAPARCELGHAGAVRGEPGPRDVVAPPGARRRVAAVLADHAERAGRSRPRDGRGVRRRRQAGRLDRPGGHAAPAVEAPALSRGDGR